MRNHPLFPFVRRLRPSIPDSDDPDHLQDFVEVTTSLYLAPFTLFGLIWLILITDIAIVWQNLVLFLVLLLARLLIQEQPFTIRLSVGEGSSLQATGSLSSVVIWAGMLVFGQSVLWVNVVAVIFYAIKRGWQRQRYQQNAFWEPFSSALQELSTVTLIYLLSFSIYTWTGGTIPFMSLVVTGWLPAIFAILANVLLPGILILPIVVHINRLVQIDITLTGMIAFLFSASALSLLMTPFAILVALLYTLGNSVVFSFMVLGIVMVNALSHYLSQVNQRSQQRTREMTQLESLGEAILQAPADGLTLVELLQQYLGRMFPDAQDIVEIRLFEGIDLPGFAGEAESLHLVHPPNQSPSADSFWDDLQKTEQPHLIIEDVILPGTKAVYGDAVIDKIHSAAPVEEGVTPVCLGGVYLLRHKSVAKSEDSLPAVQALASQIASALYRAQVHAETLTAHKMSQELEFAGSIQASFLPEDVPVVDGWGIAASLTPARQTAGDFYDFIPLGDGKLGILVADVADKGTGAALYMALSRTLIRTYAMQSPDSPAEALRQANERILEDTRANQFVTVFYGILDTKTGELIYSNAGHNPGYLVPAASPENHSAYIRTGAPMGIFGDLEWEQDCVQLSTDDTFLLYSDGVTEAQNLAEEFYTDERLLAVIKANYSQSAEQLHATIITDLQRFVGQAPQFDDITLMILKRKP